MSYNVVRMPEQEVVEEVKYSIMGKDYTIPTAEHLQSDAITSLVATVVRLHNRVQALEVELKGDTK